MKINWWFDVMDNIFNKTVFENFMKCGPKEDFFVVDNDPQGYKLSCCGSFGLGFYGFTYCISSYIFSALK